MRAGKLRHAVEIQKKISTQGKSGAPVKEMWGVFAETRAEIVPLKGLEQLEGQQMTARVTHEIRVRYRSGIKPGMRIVKTIGGNIFDIRLIINRDMRNREILMTAEEVI